MNYLQLRINGGLTRWFVGMVATVGLIFASAVPALADSTALYQQMSADIDKVNELTSYTNDTNDSAGVITTRLNVYHGYFSESSAYYASLSASLDSQFQPISDRAKNATAQIASSIVTIRNEMNGGSEAGVNRAFDSLNQGIDELNSTVEAYNQVAGTGDDSGPIYVGLSILFGIISLIIFAASRKKAITATEQTKSELKKNLFISSLWPTVGALVTTVWYYLTPPGGTYFILWGPMLIGAFYFLKEIFHYFNVRPHLNKSICQEKTLLSDKNKCDNCGNLLTEGVLFCNACGTKVKA